MASKMASKRETVGRVPRPVRCSNHARCRAARRNVVPDAIDYVLAHGRQVRRTGVTFYFLGRQDMPAADRAQSWSARLEGTVVLQGRDGEVITVYRNRRAWHAILRKLKYRSTAGAEVISALTWVGRSNIALAMAPRRDQTW